MERDTVELTFDRRPDDAMLDEARRLRDALARRRSVRHFSPEPIPLEVVRLAIEAAAQAPSGANKQPWTFALVTDPALKRRIREAAEAEEAAFYSGRAPQAWLDDLEPLGTGPSKPFLEEAPALLVVFAKSHDGAGGKHYYVKESVGIASGFLIAALHLVGLATLTHTPSPMGFLGEILGRPEHEKAFLLLPVGYPAEGCRVPALERKPRGDVLVEH